MQLILAFTIAACFGACQGHDPALTQALPVELLDSADLSSDGHPDGHLWWSKHVKDAVLGSSAAKVEGVKINSKGDLKAFMGTLVVSAIMVICIVSLFVYLRLSFPKVYSNNIRDATWSETKFGWISAAWNLTPDDVVESAGLDSALQIEYINLCIRIFVCAGIPLAVFFCPGDFLYGGGAALYTHDGLSYISMHNVAQGHWLVWMKAFAVFGVAVVSDNCIWRAHERFAEYRLRWLRSMPAPRCTTLLIQGIPYEYRTDSALRKFFQGIFPSGNISQAFVVKRTGQKCKLLVDNLKEQENQLQQFSHAWGETSQDPAKRESAAVEDARKLVEDTRKKLGDVRQRIREAADRGDLSVFSDSGFVTFGSRLDAEIAAGARLSYRSNEFRVSTPPHPSDVCYENLAQSSLQSNVFVFLGYVCIVGVFLGYLPFVGVMTALTSIHTLDMVPHVKTLCKDYPVIESSLEGVLSSLGLLLFTSLLPSVLTCIFSTFFCCVSDRWVQLRLQLWYYIFLLVSVGFCVALGRSYLMTMKELVMTPSSVFSLLASSLPACSQWYLSFILTSGTTRLLHMLRYTPLLKFLMFSKLYGEDNALEFSEPENQDYYGIGARTARLSLEVTVGIMFCTFSPLICVVLLVDLALAKLAYSYLLVFAETKKVDLGGEFWVNQVDFLYVALLAYSMMMTGVLAQWSSPHELWLPRHAPWAVALMSCVYIAVSWVRLKLEVDWRGIPLQDCVDSADAKVPEMSRYEQPGFETY